MPVLNAPIGEVVVVVVVVASEVERGVDARVVESVVVNDSMTTHPPSMSMTRPLSPRY